MAEIGKDAKKELRDLDIAESTLMAMAEMKPQYIATLAGLPAPDDIERVFDEHSKDTKWVTI